MAVKPKDGVMRTFEDALAKTTYNGDRERLRLKARDLQGITVVRSEAPQYTYVAGPMTGYVEFNEPAFEAMAYRLRKLGIKVLSPNELHAPDPDKAWEWYLRRDLAAMSTYCKRVVFLPGWERSRGATVEHATAVALEMERVYPHELESWIAKYVVEHGGYSAGVM